MRILIQLYKRVLNKHPILTQVVQTGALMGTGDVIAQVFLEKKRYNNYNFVRTGQFCTVGFCFLGPSLTLWYRFLAKHIGTSGRTVALKKVAVDQLLFAPALLGTLITLLGTIKGEPPSVVFNKVKRDYKDIMIANYKLWPAVQLINFYVVPLNYQVLVVQCVAVSWNTYLSWKTQKPDDDIHLELQNVE